ncbi:MAG TPA: hypothetical protein PKM35_06300 [Holophaga sp.]|nr:hypothetical protein [Holophaga sp.]HPS67541.1 hypothetical protein [Holophaga sp.]
MSCTDPGRNHLVWIARFQWGLLAVGIFSWLAKSWKASAAFAIGGLASIAFWHLHGWIISRMLTPSARRRWFYGALALAKLALIVLVLREMMVCFPAETLPLSVGVLLFVGGILLEACRLVVRPGHQDLD